MGFHSISNRETAPAYSGSAADIALRFDPGSTLAPRPRGFRDIGDLEVIKSYPNRALTVCFAEDGTDWLGDARENLTDGYLYRRNQLLSPRILSLAEDRVTAMNPRNRFIV